MNVSIKKTNSFKSPHPILFSQTSFTPTKRFPISSPASIISNAKFELLNPQNPKKPFIKPTGSFIN